MVKQLIAESWGSITLIYLCESTRWKKDKDIFPNKKTVIYQVEDLSYAMTESTVQTSKKNPGFFTTLWLPETRLQTSTLSRGEAWRMEVAMELY